MENALRTGHRIFIVGDLPFLKSEVVPPTLSPAFQDASGHWHGGYRAPWQILGDYSTVWDFQAGHFLRSKATNAHKIDVPVPDNARVQDYEDLGLSVVQGWNQTPNIPPELPVPSKSRKCMPGTDTASFSIFACPPTSPVTQSCSDKGSVWLAPFPG